MKSRRHFIKLSGLSALGLTGKSHASEAAKKPFIHGFNFKFKRGVPNEEVASLMKELAALKEKIPVLKEFFIGKNIAKRTHGFQYGEIAVFDKKEELMLYEKHPEHQKLVKKILPRLEIGNGMDFFPIGEAKTKLGVASYKGHFVHAFNFKFKDGVSEEEIADLMNELAGLKAKIPVLKELVVGKNEAHWHRGFQYGQISVFEKKEDLMTYDKHPEHTKVVRKIGPKVVGGHAMDFIPIEA
ncbi:MAG: Dabb family protein [Roseibacillus sp.]|nr:Dabb family protein [Roseibacillus sp.]